MMRLFIYNTKSGYSGQKLTHKLYGGSKLFLLASSLDMYRMYCDSPRYHEVFFFLSFSMLV